MTKAQEEAAHTQAPRAVVLAGPGSGKTNVIIQRVGWLLGTCQLAPEQVVVITYTNSAASEIVQRLKGLEPGYVGTLHRFCLKLLSQFKGHLGLRGIKSVLGDDESEVLLRDLMKAHEYRGTLRDIWRLLKEGNPYAHGPRYTSSQAGLVVKDFYAELDRSQSITMDAILSYGFELARVLKQAEHGYLHLLVDEYQDVSDIDHSIYQTLDVPNKFYVGDPDQGIFAFRGGNSNHLWDMASAAQQLGTGESGGWHELYRDFRNPFVIARAAEKLINHNPRPYYKLIDPEKKDGLVSFATNETPAMEAQRLTDHVQSLKFEECAVLCRYNWLVDYFTGLFEDNCIPVRQLRQHKPADDWRQTRALLTYLSQPDNDALARLWLGCVVSADEARSLSIQAAEAGNTLNDQFFHFPSEVNVDSELFQILAKKGASAQSLDHIRMVVDNMGTRRTIHELLTALESNINVELGHGVTVTTIHASKGREWPVVFMPALEEGILPTASSYTAEEDRRVCFVGMTRASSELHVSWCKYRRSPFTAHSSIIEASKPSRFLAEMFEVPHQEQLTGSFVLR